ncbi:cupin domain-containing protein [Amycolatopsis sp. cmx-4-54]|uniref:cupin domain-containing protein n=1 Tax=Amycolatopsis sp. cmx-4-54 TaxID=2790936 RepID=UPI00397BB125
MIITHSQGLVRTVDERVGVVLSRCLARRGMLYSECESIDYLRLAPGTTTDTRGRAGIERAWFVLHGSGELLPDGPRAPAISVRENDFVQCRSGSAAILRNTGETALELLLLSVFPASVTSKLPVRKPVE